METNKKISEAKAKIAKALESKRPKPTNKIRIYA